MSILRVQFQGPGKGFNSTVEVPKQNLYLPFFKPRGGVIGCKCNGTVQGTQGILVPATDKKCMRPIEMDLCLILPECNCLIECSNCFLVPVQGRKGESFPVGCIREAGICLKSEIKSRNRLFVSLEHGQGKCPLVQDRRIIGSKFQHPVKGAEGIFMLAKLHIGQPGLVDGIMDGCIVRERDLEFLYRLFIFSSRIQSKAILVMCPGMLGKILESIIKGFYRFWIVSLAGLGKALSISRISKG